MGIEGFKALYHIPWCVSLQYNPLDDWHTHRKEREVVIPMIAFIEGGMRLPMGRITRNYLIAHRIYPHQCAPNLFRVLGSIDTLNKQMGLGLTWHDIVWMNKCHLLTESGYYLKSRSFEVKFILCLSKSNKGMKDDFVIVSGEWDLHCLTQEEAPGGVP